MSARIWADGYGRWHATVTDTGNRRRDSQTARRAILGAIMARDSHADPEAIRVRCRGGTVTPTGSTLDYSEA